MMTREETDAHFARRLESFSDIVFGLSLSIVGLQLVVPTHPVDFFRHPIGLFGFALSFAVIAMFWSYQHRMFLYFFFPDQLNIAFMFIKLALIVLIPFTLQIFLKSSQDPIAYAMYSGTFGLIMSLNAIAMYRGFKRFWNHFDEPFRLEQWVRWVRVCSIAVILLVATVFAPLGVRWFVAAFFLLPISQLIIRRTVRSIPSFAAKAFSDA